MKVLQNAAKLRQIGGVLAACVEGRAAGANSACSTVE
jgi:hypothetical protein